MDESASPRTNEGRTRKKQYSAISREGNKMQMRREVYVEAIASYGREAKLWVKPRERARCISDVGKGFMKVAACEGAHVPVRRQSRANDFADGGGERHRREERTWNGACGTWTERRRSREDMDGQGRDRAIRKGAEAEIMMHDDARRIIGKDSLR